MFFNQTFCLYCSAFSHDAEKGIAMYVCHITVHSFDLFNEQALAEIWLEIF